MKGVVLAATAAALVVSGASAASAAAKPIRIVFGFSGGMLAPEQVTIEPTGRVVWHGFIQHPTRTRLSHAKVVSLSRSVRVAFAAGLKSRQCHGSGQLPDLPTDYIRATGRTVRVHGRCDAPFNRLWNVLAHAVGLGYR